MNAATRPAAVGIVLAGGSARRMQPGAPRHAAEPAPVRKEWLELGGRTLLDRVVEAVAAECGRTLVVAAPGRALPPLAGPVEIVADSTPGAGPLAALLDGLDAVGPAAVEPVILLASCDLPLLKREVVRLLVDHMVATDADWAVPEVAGHPQVLCSALRRTVVGRIRDWLAAGRRDPRGLLVQLRRQEGVRIEAIPAAAFMTVDPHLESFRDVDTPADLAAIARQLTYGDRARGAYTPPP